MPDIRYRRFERQDPETVFVFGRDFEEGEWVEVDDQTAATARGNRYFEVKGEKSFGDEPVRPQSSSQEEEEAKGRAKVAKASQDETRRAKQAEARGAMSAEDRG